MAKWLDILYKVIWELISYWYMGNIYIYQLWYNLQHTKTLQSIFDIKQTDLCYFRLFIFVALYEAHLELWLARILKSAHCDWFETQYPSNDAEMMIMCLPSPVLFICNFAPGAKTHEYANEEMGRFYTFQVSSIFLPVTIILLPPCTRFARQAHYCIRFVAMDVCRLFDMDGGGGAERGSEWASEREWGSCDRYLTNRKDQLTRTNSTIEEKEKGDKRSQYRLKTKRPRASISMVGRGGWGGKQKAVDCQAETHATTWQ